MAVPLLAWDYWLYEVSCSGELQRNLVLGPPRLNDHNSFDPNVKNAESFVYLEDPVNATTLLLRSGFYGPTMVTLTGFHCTTLLR